MIFLGFGDMAPVLFQAPLVEAPNLGQHMISNLDFLDHSSQHHFQDFQPPILPLGPSLLFETSLMGGNALDSSLDNIFSQANKAAKQKILQEMKEATRRLEEEIAASS